MACSSLTYYILFLEPSNVSRTPLGIPQGGEHGSDYRRAVQGEKADQGEPKWTNFEVKARSVQTVDFCS